MRFTKWLLFVLVIGLAGYGIWRYTRPDPIEVAVKPVSLGIVERTVANTRAGTVKACRRAKLSPSIGGQIAELPVKEGDLVQEGQLLLVLWNKDLKARVDLGENEVTAARERVRSVCVRADIAKTNADRLSRLRQLDVGTKERTDNAVAEATALAAECEGARVEVSVREAQLAVARANLERTRLIAPFDGVIGQINGELFEYVTPSPLGVATPPAVDIIGSDCYYVTAPIDEVDAADIRTGMTARITMDAFRDRRFEGRVRRIADYVLDIEKQARTVDVEAVFVHPEDFRHLLPGYSADIEVILEARENVVRVPAEAVIDGRRVFVFLPAEGRVQSREIQTGLANWDWVEVTDGLASDDQVVVNVDTPGLADRVPAVRIEEGP